LILSDERRARQLPRWRLRTARAATTIAAAVAVAAWTFSTGASYDLVSTFVHMHPLTSVATDRPEVGLLIDAPLSELPTVASTVIGDGMHASFALGGKPPAHPVTVGLPHGDQAVPWLAGGGLVRWLGTRGMLHHWLNSLGDQHHFLYASSGPSVGQWLFAHGAGGRLVAGAVRLTDHDDSLGRLHPGEVVEVTVTKAAALPTMLDKLSAELAADHLGAVSVGRLMRDAGMPA
jgi:hypothetical protein